MALTDRDYVFDGSPAWTVEHAQRVLAVKGGAGMIAETLDALNASLAPVPRDWLMDRLTILWAMFMASRSISDVDAITVWLSEHLRMLSDLPHDIAAQAIDRAIQSARHGFIPSIGEIRSIAEPLVEQRTRMAQRLRLLNAAVCGGAS